MGTTFKELYQRVLLRLDRGADGRALLAAKEGLNSAQKVLARVRNWDELMVLDTSNAKTVTDQKTYSMTSDWGLTRPKDILSIRLIDNSNSRKLVWVGPREVDKVIPYPEDYGTSIPQWYTQRGNDVELLPIPNDAYDLYVFYAQWPVDLSDDSDEIVFSDLDDVLIALGTEMADAILDRVVGVNWTSRAQALLAGAFKEDVSRPDQFRVARPFEPTPIVPYGEYWRRPFVRRNP